MGGGIRIGFTLSCKFAIIGETVYNRYEKREIRSMAESQNVEYYK